MPHEIHQDPILSEFKTAVPVPIRRKSIGINESHVQMHSVLSYVRTEIQFPEQRHPITFVHLERTHVNEVVCVFDDLVKGILIDGRSDGHVGPAAGPEDRALVGIEDVRLRTHERQRPSLSPFVVDVSNVGKLRVPNIPVFVLNIPLRIADGNVLLRNTVVIDESSQQCEDRLRRRPCLIVVREHRNV